MSQNPPTTSGVVIISGSYGFDSDLSDFPVILGRLTVIGTGWDYMASPNSILATTDNFPMVLVSGLPDYDRHPYPARLVTTGWDYLAQDSYVVSEPFVALDFTFPEDHHIDQSPPTTSGVVIWSFYPGAGVAWIVPIVINARLFPIFAGTYPEQDRRIYPVLPQFSTIIIP